MYKMRFIKTLKVINNSGNWEMGLVDNVFGIKAKKLNKIKFKIKTYFLTLTRGCHVSLFFFFEKNLNNVFYCAT